jgi:hypothetical protein
MNWRTVQLGTDTCDQDREILNLVGQRSVRIYGEHLGFDQFCRTDQHSNFCLIFFNRPLWLSEIQQRCIDSVTIPTKYLYVGLNRYQIKGNDIKYSLNYPGLSCGQAVLRWLENCVIDLGFTVVKKNCYENDQGRYFNFVQPLTWIYAEK